MAIIITGASGNFGRATIEGLLERMPARELILVTRDPSKLQDLASQGATVRRGDYDDYDSLVSAFAGGDKMLLISASKVGSRIPQHRNAINAAKAAGVGHVVYTSYVGKDGDNPSLAVGDHRGTEAMLAESGLDWTILRNSQYTDAVIEAMSPLALQRGRWIASAVDGKMAQVWREDCVASAVAVLSTPGHRNIIYNITGPELLSFREIAALISEVAGRPIEYVPVDDEGMYAFFDSLGIPREAVPDQTVGDVPWSSDDMVSVERAVREGYMAVISDDVEKLTGRAPKSIRAFALERQDDLRSA
ncbi:SDR family oxidoreductase [Sphingobium xanthum]|uniref:SDR family oxidoreductase n=1 Tax=Sphingobium xanthum TaxID=1387165 RepID=UPI001C8C3B2E|nr:SDR family oxidoreductase [Sphingobium xanthum]